MNTKSDKQTFNTNSTNITYLSPVQFPDQETIILVSPFANAILLVKRILTYHFRTFCDIIPLKG